MIDIQQLTSLISAFRVETEKSAIKWAHCQTCLSIADREQIMQRKHLARNRRLHPPGHRRLVGHSHQRDRVQHHPLLEGNERQYRFLYDIQQRNVDDHSNVILQLMARSMVDGATSSLTLAIGTATRTRASVLTAEDYIRIQGIGETNDAVKRVSKMST